MHDSGPPIENATHVNTEQSDEEGEETAIAPPNSVAPRLTKEMRFQVAVWIVEGYKNSQIRDLLDRRGVRQLTDATLTYYRQNAELLEEAKTYLRQTIMGIAYAEKSQRVKALVRHLNKLEALIDAGGLMEESIKVVSFGKKMETVTEKKFATGLSKAYIETMNAVAKEVDPLGPSIVVNTTQNNLFASMSAEEQSDMMKALTVDFSKIMPRLVAPEEREAVVEGDYRVEEGENEDSGSV